MYHRKAF